jgi:hypothetical protein
MSIENIKLNFVNRSADTNNSSIVIFQQNVAEDFGEIAIAWQVIKNCGRDDNHPFDFPMLFKVSASDSYGNYTPQMTAYPGQAYEMVKDPSGDVLKLSTAQATNPFEVEIRNNLETGAINGNCFKSGKLLAAKTNLAPGQKAVFQFQPRIYIGAVSQIEEGDVMNSAIIQQVNTEINLFGIMNADIVMSGGGAGPSSEPFTFNLANINR